MTVRKVFISSFAALMAAVIWFSAAAAKIKSVSASAPAQGMPLQLILDAGHGGFDGGAVGIGGVVEKDLNLAVSRKTASIARLAGFDVVEVRTADCAVCEDSSASLRQQKVSDMHRRLSMMQEYPQALFLSIHQNQYPQASCCGTQIFYSGNDGRSAEIAQALQSGITVRLQAENTRQSKQAGKNLFLLDQAKIPAVLVECGFLSNREECEKLCENGYQQQMAYAIVCSLLEYAGQDVS